jgi:hypothetical protein
VLGKVDVTVFYRCGIPHPLNSAVGASLRAEAGAGAMLLAYRLAGLSALEAYYARVAALKQTRAAWQPDRGLAHAVSVVLLPSSKNGDAQRAAVRSLERPGFRRVLPLQEREAGSRLRRAAVVASFDLG